MSLILSKQAEYALRAVLYISAQPPEAHTNTKVLSKSLKIPHHFLGKILQPLARRGILHSLKGPNGGFRLGKSPERITLFQIVDAIDGSSFTSGCVLGFPSCSDSNPCPLHNSWAGLRDGIRDMLADRTIAEIAGSIGRSRRLQEKLRLRRTHRRVIASERRKRGNRVSEGRS